LTLTNFEDLLFGSGGHDTLKIGTNDSSTLPGTISGFTLASEIIDLTAVGTDGALSRNGNLLTIAGSLGSVTLQLDGSDAASFSVTSDGTLGVDLIACFCRGTLILTPDGEVPVEDLAIGVKV